MESKSLMFIVFSLSKTIENFLILMLLNSGVVILQFSKEILSHLITVIEVMKLCYRKLAK